MSVGARAPADDAVRRTWSALGPRTVAWAGGLLGLAVLGAALAFAVYEHHVRLQAESQRSELLARVLEEQATRSFETASLALAALADVVARGPAQGDARVDSALTQVMIGLPVLRSMAVVDRGGQVLTSTEASETGLQLDLSRLGVAPAPGHEATGPLIAGRGLAALRSGAAPSAVRGVGFVPMWRGVTTPAGQSRLLVAVVNTDAIANHQHQVLRDQSRSSLLVSFQGQVLAAAGSAVAPGQLLRGLPVFDDYLPQREAASYVGTGTQPGRQIVAFRASAARPLLVIVEAPLDLALQAWQHNMRWLAGATTVVLLMVALMTLTAVRSLRARAAAQRQRAEAQAEVAQRERELSVIVKSVQELLFRTDAQGRLSFVNARWQAASGLPEKQALGRRLADLVPAESTAAAAALFDTSDPGGVRSAIVLLGPPGDVRRFELAVVPLLAGDRIAGFAGSAMDVTAQFSAQSQLRSQLAFTELLLEVMPVPLVVLDAEGRYTSVNQAWESFTGRRREQVLGQRPEDGLPTVDASRHRAHDAELRTHGGSVRFECSLTHQDGSRRDLSIIKAAVPGEGREPAGFVLAYQDVSEFREAERATRAARDLAEDASRAKTEFVANISHELRTPLQTIIGFSELGMVRAGPQQQRLGSMFGDIHAAGQRMLALVNDLLDVAKIESTVGTFHLERTDVRALVRDVVGELSPLLDARRLRVELALSEAPLTAKVDPQRFQQVVRNVLANAIRFSPEGEALTVAGDIGPDNRIHLSVRDHGPGIPEAELDKIFEAFVQSSKTKDGSGGTGLGLAICRKIVDAHGGEIHAENHPGGGATFHIRLPSRGFAQTTTGG